MTVSLPAAAQEPEQSKEAFDTSYDGPHLPPEELWPPANEEGLRVVSPERRRLWARYKKQSYGLPITTIVVGAIPLLVSINEIRACSINYCRESGRGLDPWVTGGLIGGAALVTLGVVWLSVRMKKRRLLAMEAEELNEREQFRARQLALSPQATPDGRGGGLRLSGSF